MATAAYSAEEDAKSMVETAAITKFNDKRRKWAVCFLAPLALEAVLSFPVIFLMTGLYYIFEILYLEPARERLKQKELEQARNRVETGEARRANQAAKPDPFKPFDPAADDFQTAVPPGEARAAF